MGGFEIVYSPAILALNTFEAIDVLNILGNSITLAVLFFLLLIYILYLLKLEGGLRKGSVYLAFIATFLLFVFVLIKNINDPINDMENYKLVRNYDKAKKITGVLSDINTKILPWPGSRLQSDFFLKVANFNIGGSEFIVNKQVGWKVAQKREMPLCYTGDIRKLLSPYIGQEIKMTYYRFISSDHPTDDSRNVCIVDLAVKQNKNKNRHI